MPPRGTPSLWPVRILTDFGKDAYVLWTLGGRSAGDCARGAAVAGGRATAAAAALGSTFSICSLAVSVPATLPRRSSNGAVGRGRPFVGGQANAFNFAPFNGTEAYFSLPSAHAVTAFALAFGVAAIWPRARVIMAVYAVLIAMTRLVLLAHHPSDVVAGAVLGVLGALVARYWFAVRRLGFAIDARRGNWPL